MEASKKDQAKSDNFKRLSDSRLEKTLNEIRLIGNLSNKNNYEYTPEQAEELFSKLEQALKTARARFFVDSAK